MIIHYLYAWNELTAPSETIQHIHYDMNVLFKRFARFLILSSDPLTTE